MSHAQATVLIAVLFLGGLALIAVVLSGWGSPDRSHDKHPRLPGHDVQDRLDRRDD